jgi:hypothetical protein
LVEPDENQKIALFLDSEIVFEIDFAAIFSSAFF